MSPIFVVIASSRHDDDNVTKRNKGEVISVRITTLLLNILIVIFLKKRIEKAQKNNGFCKLV